nr:RNA-dependent RNA polymerase [Picobirnavirus sp.]
MEKKKPNLGRYFDLPNPGLRAYFQRTVTGNPDDYRPPFWKGQSREAVLAQWQTVIDSLGVKERYPGLYDFEMDMKSKVGPMSIQLPLKDRIESIEAYFDTPKSSPVSQEAIAHTIRFFSKAGGIRLRSRPNTVSKMRLSTNSGSPYFTKRRRVVDKPQGNYEYCATLGWRGQEGGIHDDDVKQRVIWMMPFDLNVRELQFYQPAIEAIQKAGLIPAYISMDAVDEQVTKLFDTKGHDDVVICTDFSKFDQHFQKDMQDAAELVLRGLSTASADMEDWFREVYPKKFSVPLVCSEDLEFTGSHGMGSGSGGTNFDECMAHKALQFEAALTAGKVLNRYSMAYGDDGILTYPGIEVDHVIRTYTAHGQEMNKDKQYISTHDCVVLRRYHDVNYRENGIMVGVYSTFRALGRLLAQERFYDPEVWGPKQVTLRAWSILENCNHSPYFEQFVQFVMKGDKYRLGLDIPGFMSEVTKIAQESNELIPDFLGYTKNNMSNQGGITSWRIYKYLITRK